jgi:nucleoid DNA-binding protein
VNKISFHPLPLPQIIHNYNLLKIFNQYNYNDKNTTNERGKDMKIDLDEFVESLANGEEVYIRGLGKFSADFTFSQKTGKVWAVRVNFIPHDSLKRKIKEIINNDQTLLEKAKGIDEQEED